MVAVGAEILRRSIGLDCPIDHAFDVFVGKIDFWWPRTHRKSPDSTLSIEGSDLVERSADGSRWVMARIVRSRPPDLLVLDWYPGSPAAPTNVEVQFAPAGDSTEITVTHRALRPNAAEIWPARVPIFEKGWEAVLPAFKSFVEEIHGERNEE